MVKYRLRSLAQDGEAFAERMKSRRGEALPEPVYTTNEAMKDWIVLRVGERYDPDSHVHLLRRLRALLGTDKVMVLPSDMELMVFEEVE